MANYSEQLKSVELAKQKLEAKTFRLMEKAMKSDNPDDMIAASNTMSRIQQKTATNPKAFFIDPLQFNINLGYKDKPYTLSYSTLKRMSKTPIINSIIKTRKNQIADFAEPQSDRYSTGFVIRKKPKFGMEQKMDNRDKKIATALTDFMLNTGGEYSWTNDDFDTFIRKIVDDSLTYDQMTFECVRNRRGKLESFIATDGATFRLADSAFQEDYDNPFFQKRGSGLWVNENLRALGVKEKGYYPQYVQVYQNAIVNDFYPWELCFGVRNPSASIYANGYGCSELEELINVVTSLLWGDEYNRRFFSQGSAPKGLLRVKGNVNEASLQQFKQQWQAMITGVMQSWKTPVVEADVDWIDLQKNNRDMEYSSWIEYLIKLACAIYNIDPIEIGWDISRSTGSGGLFEGSQSQRLQNSKDRGLYPLLKFIQRKLNKYIIEPLNPDFEFVFMGLNGMTIEQELDMDIKKLGSFQTIDEIRQKWDLPSIEHGDIIENAVYAQQLASAQMPQMGQQAGESKPEVREVEEETEEVQNPFDLYVRDNEEESETEEEETEEKAEDDLFVKAFETFMEREEEKLNS